MDIVELCTLAKTQLDTYHMAKKLAQPKSSLKHSKVSISFEQKFPSYNSLRQHRRKEYGATQQKTNDTVVDFHKIVEGEGESGEKLKVELSAFYYFLVDTEIENQVLNFQMSKLDTNIINENFKEVFRKLDSAAKFNPALGFVLGSNETSECRYFYVHENNTLLEKSKTYPGRFFST